MTVQRGHLAPVLDLRPRLAARAAQQQAQQQRRRGDRVCDVLFACGLAWSLWRSVGRPRR